MRQYFICAALCAISLAQREVSETATPVPYNCTGMSQQQCDKERGIAPAYRNAADPSLDSDSNDLQWHEKAINYISDQLNDSDSDDDDSEDDSILWAIQDNMENLSQFDIAMMQQQVDLMAIRKRRVQKKKEITRRQKAKDQKTKQIHFMAKMVLSEMSATEQTKYEDQFKAIVGSKIYEQLARKTPDQPEAVTLPADWQPDILFEPSENWMDSDSLDGSYDFSFIWSQDNSTQIDPTDFDGYYLNKIEVSSNSNELGYFWNFYAADGGSTFKDFDEDDTTDILTLDQDERPIGKIRLFADTGSLRGMILWDQDGDQIGKLGYTGNEDTEEAYTMGAKKSIAFGKGDKIIGVRGKQWDSTDTAPVKFQFQILGGITQ